MSLREDTGRHIQALDGVRGVAILMVIFFHAHNVFLNSAEMPWAVFQLFGMMWAGVDLFFVLSGFLITGILLDSSGSPNYFRIFYIRRILRIFPLYFAYLFFILAIVRILFQHFLRLDEWPSSKTWWYFLYLQNWKPGHGADDRYLDHLWSLAIEEQFYLIWPAVLWLLSRKRLPWATLGLAGVALGARLYFGSHGTGAEALYRLTPTHMDGLAIGAFACAAVRQFRWRLDPWVKPVFMCSALVFVVLAAKSPVWSDPWLRTAGVTSLAIACACVVFRAATAGSGLVHCVFSVSWLRSCGKYSYGMYVWHASMFSFTLPYVQRLTSHGWPWALALSLKYLYLPVLAASAYGVARISWACLEEPFQRLKRYAPYRAVQPEETFSEQAAEVR